MSAQRLDKALLQRGLVTSRSRAGQLITAAAVRVDGVVVTKPSAIVGDQQQLSVSATEHWVSRAAHKLLGALEAFPTVDPSGRRCLDAGASTGGFTQVLLHRGAAEVVAVDVGHDQLAPELRNDPRVTNIEGLNLRHLQPGQLGERFGLIVADLSFISLRLVVDALAEQANDDADVLLMVKPQFEIGRDRLARTGVVTSPELRHEAVAAVGTAAAQSGLALRGAARSALPGRDGNAEFFLHLQRAPGEKTEAESMVSDRLSSVEFADPQT